MSAQESQIMSLALFLLSGLLPAVFAGGQDASAGRTATASIAGKTVSRQDGRPLAGVSVRVKDTTGSFQAAPDPNESVASAVSGPQGDFIIEGIPPGSYQLYADLPGYARSHWGCRDESGSGPCDEVRVASGQRLAGVEVKMTPEGSISGIVRNGNKEPLARVRLTALRAFFDDGRRQWLPVAAAESGSEGEYHLNPLPTGSYVVQAEPSSPPRIAGAQNQRESAGAALRRTYYPDADSIQMAAPVAVRAGSESGGIDFRIPLRKLTRVSGHVKWGAVANPAKPLVLALQTADFDLLASVAPRLAMVGKDGAFSFDEVLPGEYILEPARIRVDPAAYRHVSGAMRIAVPEQGLADIEFVPVQASNLRGNLRITGEDTKTPEADPVVAGGVETRSAGALTAAARPGPKPPPPPGMAKPRPEGDVRPEGAAESAVVTLQTAKEDANARREIWLRLKAVDRIPLNPPRTAVDQQGEFRFDHVPAGRYIVELQGLPSNCYVKEIRHNGRDIAFEGLDLSNGGDGEMQVVLARKAARITGKAVTSAGKPVRAARVSLWRRDGNMTGGSRLAEVAITDREGRFEFPGLGPGQYSVVAWEDLEYGLARTLPFCQLFASGGEAATLAEGEGREVNLVAVPASKTRDAEFTFAGSSSVP